MDKIEKNETELSALKEQLAVKSRQLSTLDDETYHKLVQQFVGYMSDVKSPEAFALKDVAIDRIDIEEDGVTIHFKPGVTVDEDTMQYFNC